MSKKLEKDNIDFVIYHHPCTDGTGSAYIAWKYLSTKYPDRDVEYYPATFGSLPPDVTGKNVLMCDFSYRKNILLNMIKQSNSFLIIDHHKSAEIDLKDLDDQYKIFDMNHSGASLTWIYFYGEETMPLLIKYIEDRDIWRKQMPQTDAFASWFYSLPQEYEVFDKYLDNNSLLEMIESKGKPFNEHNDIYINQAILYAVPKFMRIGNNYYFVCYLNTTILKSDIGNKIFDQYPFIDFSAVYSISDHNNTTSFSLRSTSQHADVSEIAFHLGGGGHRNASGIKLNYVTNTLPGEIYDNGKLYWLINNIYFESIKFNNNEYNIVYLNSPIYKSKLGRYLLQTKYIDNNNNIQTALAILNHRKQTSEYKEIDIAAIWNYDGDKNQTYYSFVINKNISDDKFSEIKNILKIDNKYDFVIKDIIYDGLMNKLSSFFYQQ